VSAQNTENMSRLLRSALCSVLVTAITAMAVLEKHKSPHTSFVRSRLVDPVAAISTAYGPDESKLKRTGTIHELFGHETMADRLSVAVHDNATHLPVIRKSTLPPTGTGQHSDLSLRRAYESDK
jgi:hypothetical protein